MATATTSAAVTSSSSASASTSRRSQETEALATLLTDTLLRWMRECGSIDLLTDAVTAEPQVAPRGPKQPPFWIESFAAQRLPGVSLKKYVARIVAYAKCTPECFVMALCFIRRLMRKHQLPTAPAGSPPFARFRESPHTHLCGAPVLNMFTVYRLFAAATVVAIKSHDDHYYTMSYYAQVSGVATSEIVHMEARLLLSATGLGCQALVGRQEYLTMLHKHMLRSSAEVAAACGLTDQRLAFASGAVTPSGARSVSPQNGGGGGGGGSTSTFPQYRGAAGVPSAGSSARTSPASLQPAATVGGSAPSNPLATHFPLQRGNGRNFGAFIEPSSHTASPQPAHRNSAAASLTSHPGGLGGGGRAATHSRVASDEFFNEEKEGLDDADEADMRIICGSGGYGGSGNNRHGGVASAIGSMDALDDEVLAGKSQQSQQQSQQQRRGAGGGSSANHPVLMVPQPFQPLRNATVAPAAGGTRRGSNGGGGGDATRQMSGASSASSLCGLSTHQSNPSQPLWFQQLPPGQLNNCAPFLPPPPPPLFSAPPVPEWLANMGLFYAPANSPAVTYWSDL